MRKCLNWDTCLSKEVYCNSNVSQTGVWGRSLFFFQKFEIFFKSILLHKNWRSRGELLLKNGTIGSYAYKPRYCLGRIYIELGPWHFRIFSIFSCQIQVKTTKKSLPFERGVPGTMSYVKTVPGYFITFIERLDECLS